MADAKKELKAKAAPPVLTPEELRASAQLQIDGAALALDFRDQAHYYNKAAELLSSIPNDDDSAAQAKTYLKKAEELFNNGYQDTYALATARMEQAGSAEDFYQAATAFHKIEGYQDSDQLAEECEKQYAKRSRRKRPKLIIVILILALLAIAAIGIQTSFGKYQLGQLYLSTSRYSNALSIFSHLDRYRESEILAKESRYQLAEQYMAQKHYQKAIKQFQKLEEYKDSQTQQTFAEQQVLLQAEPGDTVSFGNKKWIVLNVQKKYVMLLKKTPTKITAGFNQTRTKINWKDCSLRTWLNTNFLSQTFSSSEQKLLTSRESDLADSVFLLSAGEAEHYSQVLKNTNYNWWLRTSGTFSDTAAFVSPSNRVMDYGYPVSNTEIRTRPAIWVDCTISGT